MCRRHKLNLTGPFVLHSLEMRESPAWRALSDNARRILDRVEVEHMGHGGAENGKLICTYDDFCKAGIRRNSISRAIRECVALGFLEITVLGGLKRADIRRPSNYRLTYVNGRGKSPDPTHDWRKIATSEHAAEAILGESKEAKTQRGTIFSPAAKTILHLKGRKRYCTPAAKTIPGQRKAPSGENDTAIYISGGARY
jgi:hypothetical protein